GDVQEAAFAGAVTCDECREDRRDRVQATARAVRHGGARHRWLAGGRSLGHVEIPGGGEVVEVVAGPLRPRSALSVAGGRAVDDARVASLDVVEADAEPTDNAGT